MNEAFSKNRMLWCGDRGFSFKQSQKTEIAELLLSGLVTCVQGPVGHGWSMPFGIRLDSTKPRVCMRTYGHFALFCCILAFASLKSLTVFGTSKPSWSSIARSQIQDAILKQPRHSVTGLQRTLYLRNPTSPYKEVELFTCSSAVSLREASQHWHSRTCKSGCPALCQPRPK
eukprot:3461198-Amphidinium_carterae.1